MLPRDLQAFRNNCPSFARHRSFIMLRLCPQIPLYCQWVISSVCQSHLRYSIRLRCGKGKGSGFIFAERPRRDCRNRILEVNTPNKHTKLKTTTTLLNTKAHSQPWLQNLYTTWSVLLSSTGLFKLLHVQSHGLKLDRCPVHQHSTLHSSSHTYAKMPSTERDASRDSERYLRHQQSASTDGGRAIVPM
jgi:hypothetical protein